MRRLTTIAILAFGAAAMPALAQNNDGWAAGTIVGDAYGVNNPAKSKPNAASRTTRIGASANKRDVTRLGQSTTAAKPKAGASAARNQSGRVQ